MQSFPYPSDATHKIWSRLAYRLQRYSVWKCGQWTTTDGWWQTDGRRTIGILQAHLVSLQLRWAKNPLFYLFPIISLKGKKIHAEGRITPMWITRSGPFGGYWSWDNFYSHSLSTAESSKAVVINWQKYVLFLLVNCLGDLRMPGNSVCRKTYRVRHYLNSFYLAAKCQSNKIHT